MSKVESVVQAIRNLAESAGPGGKFPPFRTLMRDLNVSQATIGSAHQQLEREGVLERRPGSGIYASMGIGMRPFLLVCDSASFVGCSAFWEVLMEGLLTPFVGHPDRLVVEFTTPSLQGRSGLRTEQLLSESTWAKLRARAFSAAMLVCPDERLGWEIEKLGTPVVSFGCPSHTMIRFATLEVCSLGVGELVRLGCRKIALYNAPHVGAKEVFNAALSAHGGSECVVPPTVAFRFSVPELGHRTHLVDSGLQESVRLFGPNSGKRDRPDGILSVDDMFTQGLLMGLQRYGIRPGKDVQIATHCNRGVPTLSAWKEEIVGLEFGVRELAAALTSAAEQIARGETPNRYGWEQSLLLNEREGKLRTLILRPSVSRPSLAA